MAVEVKICGLTRAADAEIAAEAGASWVGVVFAGGPRELSLPTAVEVFAGLSRRVGKVGVFGQSPLARVLEAVDVLGLHAVQLHHEEAEGLAQALRERGIAVWRVARVGHREDVRRIAQHASHASVVLAEPSGKGHTGGRGIPLDLGLAVQARAALPSGIRFALAGGLKPETVRHAIRTVRPDIVDVSSGVEAAVGVKDPARVRAFVREASTGAAG